MNKILLITLMQFLGTDGFAQDTIRVAKPDDDRYCFLTVCSNKICSTDSILKSVLESEAKIELRIDDRCSEKKKGDVFVSSFEIWVERNGVKSVEKAYSSFLNGPQSKIIRSLKTGQSFEIKNVVLHTPVGLRKTTDISITIK
jgi:hypothetical protein